MAEIESPLSKEVVASALKEIREAFDHFSYPLTAWRPGCMMSSMSR
ncbi:MAG: hypothetical protein ACLPQX_19585 [Syntrophobacteraceae bacterium]